MKKLLLLATTLLATLCPGTLRAIEPTDTQMWWGYYTSNDAYTLNLVNDALGYGAASTFDAAIYVPPTEQLVATSHIKALRLWLGEDITAVTSDIRVWISRTQPTDIAAADYVQTVPRADLIAGQNDIELTTPFDVDRRAIYVGYTLATTTRAYLIMCNGDDTDGAFFFRHNNDTWYDFSTRGYGKLALQLLLDGGTYPADNVQPTAVERTVALSGQVTTMPVTVVNKGKDPVTTISYTVAVQGQAPTEERNTTLNALSYGASQTFAVRFPAVSHSGKYTATINVTKVNGKPNTAATPTATGTLVAVSETPAVTPVVEEFTGTWCGYCPYGTVGMQNAHDTYGDKVVLIAVHSGDVMEIDAYGPVINTYATGYPSSRINRGSSSIYPYYLTNYLPAALQAVSPASINLAATWTDDSQTAVHFATESRFYYDATGEDYGIAFLLVADGLKGTTSGWNQNNYLSGQSGQSDMTFWYNAGSSVSGLEYNHVAVAAWDVLRGIDASVSTTVETGKTQTFDYTADITGASLIQDKTRLTAVALLIDRETGAIAGAAQTPIAQPTAITAPHTPNTPNPNPALHTPWHTINGQSLSGQPTHKGLYIRSGKKIIIR